MEFDGTGPAGARLGQSSAPIIEGGDHTGLSPVPEPPVQKSLQPSDKTVPGRSSSCGIRSILDDTPKRGGKMQPPLVTKKAALLKNSALADPRSQIRDCLQRALPIHNRIVRNRLEYIRS